MIVYLSVTGIINFHGRLIETLKSSDGQSLPTSWFKFLTAIQAQPEKILLWQDALDIFESVVQTMQESVYMLQGSTEKSLEMVLRYLHVTGMNIQTMMFKDVQCIGIIDYHGIF